MKKTIAQLESARKYRNSDKGKEKIKEWYSKPEVKERFRIAAIKQRKTESYKIFAEKRKKFPQYIAYQKKYRLENPETKEESDRHFNGHLIRKYKITSNEYNKILDKQNYVCAICSKKQGKNRLGVDHDHSCCAGIYSCGKCVRELLCTKCNIMLGGSGDSTSILRLAIEYLERHSDKRRYNIPSI